MAQRDTRLLEPDTREMVAALVTGCRQRGVEMRPYCTVRTPQEQAKIWRQSRSGERIERRIRDLRDKGAPWLADVLEGVGPQEGPPITGALPGESWHQWAEACDLFWLVDGDAVWGADKMIDGQNGYRVMTEVARSVGLHVVSFTGSDGRRIRDWPHVQRREAGSPRSLYTWEQIDAAMREGFGGQ